MFRTKRGLQNGISERDENGKNCPIISVSSGQKADGNARYSGKKRIGKNPEKK